MLNITNCQGNANQKHNKVSLHTRYGGYYQKKEKGKQRRSLRTQRNWNSCALLMGVQNSAAIKGSVQVPQKIKNS